MGEGERRGHRSDLPRARRGPARGVRPETSRGPAGVALLGGGTLASDRGSGYYTALVHARWHDAVGRGTPLLCTVAGKMSRPILERLGFEQVGEIRVLVDDL